MLGLMMHKEPAFLAPFGPKTGASTERLLMTPFGYSLPSAPCPQQVRFTLSFRHQRLGRPLCPRFRTCLTAASDGAK